MTTEARKNELTEEQILYALKHNLTNKVDEVNTLTGEVKTRLLKEYHPLHKYYANDYFFNLLNSKITKNKPNPKSISKNANRVFEE